MGFENYKLTEETVLALKPIFESILSRKYGMEIKYKDLTAGNVTINEEKFPREW
ncbi:hypothetical protein [Bacillus massiliglaciei]|uniref:hypothetical protein n=1 Tax=Bacillus massiliglaciei TaxID=1816693 RepID=UPI0018FECD08|nr:hypothetical protein [Bacillus massiliglaciei]